MNNIISYSAGVGRTGCFIAASIGIEQIKVCFQGCYLRKFFRSPSSKVRRAQDKICCGQSVDWSGVNSGNFGEGPGG